MVGGRRVHVDDRAAHRDLAARLDLVLAPVADRDEPLDELVAVDLRARLHDDRLDVLDVRAEPLHERAHRRDHDRGQVVAARAQPPDDAQAPAHRLDRGRHPLERQRLPRREQLDRVVAEELAQVGGEAFGLVRRSAPRARSAGGRWPTRASRANSARAGSGTATGRAEPPVAAATTGSAPSRVVSPARAGSFSHGRDTGAARAVDTRDAGATRGSIDAPAVPIRLDSPVARCSGSSRRRRRRRGSSRPRRPPLRS